MKAKQDARVDGDHDIVVQVSGDGIQVQVGLPHLTLVPPRNRLPRKSPGPVDLLNPYRRSIALVGRDADMESLWDWLYSSRPIAVRTLSGRAGGRQDPRRHRTHRAPEQRAPRPMVCRLRYQFGTPPVPPERKPFPMGLGPAHPR